MKLIIYGQLVGLNEYTKACRSRSWQAGAQMKKNMETIIKGCILAQALEPIDGQAELHFRWYEPNKKRDMDNVCFAKKFILDALVSEGIIIADGWRGVKGFTDEFFVDKDNPRIEVDICRA